MFKNLRIGVVGAIILALIAPASPASTAAPDLGAGFTAQSANLTVEVIDNATDQVVDSYVELQRRNGDGYDFVGDFSSENGDTRFTFSGLAAGEYRLYADSREAELPVNSSFDLLVGEDSSISISFEGQPSQTLTAVDGVFQLPAFQANIYFPMLLPDGTPFMPVWGEFEQLVGIHGHLEELSSDNVWIRSGNIQMYFFEREVEGEWEIEAGVKLRVPEANKSYRAVVQPYGVPGAARVVSPTFSVTNVNQEPQKLDAVSFLQAALQVSVVAPGETTPIENSSVRVFTLDDSTEDFSNGWSSTPISVLFSTAGVYQIEISTDNPEFSDLARVNFTVDVVDVDGALVGTVRDETAVNGVYLLELRAANFIVSVVDPDSPDTALNQAEVRIHEASGTQRGKYVFNGWSNQGSTIAFMLADGSYYVEVNPHDGNYLLASNSYLVTVFGSSVTVTTLTNTPVGLANGAFPLAVSKANVVGKVVDSNGDPIVVDWDKRRWVSVNLLSVEVDRIEWLANSNVDDQGRFSFRITEAGTYRVEIRPEGYPDSSNQTVEFSVTDENLGGITTLGTGDPKVIVLPQPDLRVAVRIPGGNENLRNVNVEVFRGHEYITNSSTAQGGIAGISLPTAGTYEIRINPPRSATGTARASYSAVLTIAEGSDERSIAVSNSGGDLSTTLINGSDVYLLTLGVPTLSGEVTSPDGSQLMRDVEVIPVDRSTGWEMWEYSARTNTFGQWSMALPAGTWDVYARAPWGDATFGDGDRIGPVVVGEDGVATLPTTLLEDGYTAGAFNLSLNLPTWSGVMVSPSDPNQALTNGSICLALTSEESRSWNCAQTNGLGEWALSKPAGFNGFSANDELIIEQWDSSDFAPKRLRGKDAIEAELGQWVDGGTFSGIMLSPALPNLEIFVQAGTDDEGNPVPARNAWVGVDDGMEWLGGRNTNSLGLAMISIPDDKLTDALNIQVSVEHNAALSENYAGVRYEASEDLTATAPRRIDVPLAAPNLRVEVYEPASSNLVTYSWIEVLNESTGEWLGGSNTNRNGFGALSLPANGTYTLTVNPPWDGGADFSKKSYTVVVDGSRNIVSVEDAYGDGAVFDEEANIFALELANPSLRGVVRNSAGTGVRDSWITPIEQNGRQYLWWLGTNSRLGGEFAMDLADGTYQLEANPSWNNLSGDTKSKRCSIQIATGNLQADYAGADKCAISDNKVQLSLREPNVTFTLKAPGGAVVPFANVGMFLGDWSVWSQSSSTGVVAVNLDAAEIKTSSGLTSAGNYDIRIIVEPPYGNSDLARFECNSTDDAKQLCSNIPDFVLAADSLNPSFSRSLETGFEVLFSPPNTRLQVADADSAPLLVRGSWVNIFEEGAGRNWLASGGSDSSGFVSFNLDLSSDPGVNTDLVGAAKTYTVEINPPHNLRGELAQVTYTGLTHAEVNGEVFDLAEPNMKLKIFDKDKANGARWAWVGVEVVDSADNSPIAWYTGAGTDRNGQVSLSLANDKRYKIMLNPGSGTVGSFTSCLFDVDSEGAVFEVENSCDTLETFNNGVWEIKLSGGNVTGEAYFMTGENNETKQSLGGALVVATAGSQRVTTTTKSDGTYALQLDNVAWTIEVFYVPKPGEEDLLVSNKLSLTATATNDPQVLNAVFTEAD